MGFLSIPQGQLRLFLRWLPELLLAAILLFFAFRELGTFPAAWEDDGVFMTVARNLAEGRGYVLPILDETWRFPYVLGIGPPLILPVALSIKLFGFSVIAARIPAIAYLLGTVLALYLWTRRAMGVSAARWSTALLITLSAFINNGKPVLGEIPGLFYFALGILALTLRLAEPALSATEELAQGPASGGTTDRMTIRRSIVAGLLFGLAAVTKLTFAVAFPALGLALIVALVERRHTNARALIVTLMTGIVLFAGWKFIELQQAGGFAAFVERFVGRGEGGAFRVLREQPQLLLRLPYLAFGLLFAFAILGWWKSRKTIPRDAWIVMGTTVLLFILHFLNNEGWYRHLLPGHVLLLPFVPAGILSFISILYSLTERNEFLGFIRADRRLKPPANARENGHLGMVANAREGGGFERGDTGGRLGMLDLGLTSNDQETERAGWRSGMLAGGLGSTASDQETDRIGWRSGMLAGGFSRRITDGKWLRIHSLLSAALLLPIVLAQGLWQLDHRGSSLSTEAEEAARVVMERFPDRNLVIRHSEIFVRLPANPRWRFLPVQDSIHLYPASFVTLTEEQACIPQIQRVSNPEEFEDRLEPVAGRFKVVLPSSDECPRTLP